LQRGDGARVALKESLLQGKGMDLADFKNLADPSSLDLVLQALWHAFHDNWDRAHDLAQEAHSRDGDWVHAYLHRKEGDTGNAGYWYSRAGRAPVVAGVSHDAERDAIATALLAGA
jgi:hypothetical protein